MAEEGNTARRATMFYASHWGIGDMFGQVSNVLMRRRVYARHGCRPLPSAFNNFILIAQKTDVSTFFEGSLGTGYLSRPIDTEPEHTRVGNHPAHAQLSGKIQHQPHSLPLDADSKGKCRVKRDRCHCLATCLYSGFNKADCYSTFNQR